MILLTKLFRRVAGLGALVVATLAILAFFGFLVPQFDLLNHVQLGLFFGTLAGLAASFVLFAKGRWRLFLVLASTLGFLASAATFVPEWAASLEPRAPLPSDNRPILKVMTHNLFGLNDDMARVDAAIQDEDPDIIAFQEYFGGQAKALHPLVSSRYPYFVRCRGGKRANIGLYSKIPFDTAMGESDCPDTAYGTQRTAHILARFTLADGTGFSVLTTHVDWPLPILRQRQQLADLAGAIDAVDGPLIVVGDFNSTPWSYALRGFERDADLTRQTRNLVTYPVLFTLPDLIQTVPFLPLDHVFTRGNLAVHDLHAGAPTGSDHLPVVFSFSVTPAGSP